MHKFDAVKFETLNNQTGIIDVRDESNVTLKLYAGQTLIETVEKIKKLTINIEEKIISVETKTFKKDFQIRSHFLVVNVIEN